MHPPKDESCLVDDEGFCVLCGQRHGEPCRVCGGRAYHRRGCQAGWRSAPVPVPAPGTPVLLVPWVGEGPNEEWPGVVMGEQPGTGLAQVGARPAGAASARIFFRPGAALLVVERRPCAGCEDGRGWRRVDAGRRVITCDTCGRYESDQVAAVAAEAWSLSRSAFEKGIDTLFDLRHDPVIEGGASDGRNEDRRTRRRPRSAA